MVLITEWVGFAWAKHPARTSKFVEPDGHRLVKAKAPPRTKLFGHICVPGGYHLSNLPELVSVGGRYDIGERQARIYVEEAPL